MRFAAGQRWISEPEPELGLGIVLDVESGRVKMFFPASNAMRLYAGASAPLRRVRFKINDKVCSHEGVSFVVQIVNERSEGVLTYGGPNGERLAESQLCDTLTYDKPGDRIASAQVDDCSLFSLRFQALEHRHRIYESPAYGFTGARIDLIPHQLAIAHEVANRHCPRVLLADEVGLGKTIEACLILHRLHLTGKAARVLILVPEALVHQWFVELYRRFNLRFAIFDEERCAAIEENHAGSNPFLDDQLILAPLGWLANSETRRSQVTQAGWNLLIVDEAHHLTWTPAAASPEYTLVEELGRGCPGISVPAVHGQHRGDESNGTGASAIQIPAMLLLTATPQQLGMEGHFARLRLLDPDRYPSLEAFQEEAKEYAPVVQIAEKLIAGKKLTAKDTARLSTMPGRIAIHAEALSDGDGSAREALLEELLDQHGTGRVIFRNTRAALSGFPKRSVQLVPLEGDVAAAQAEFRGETVALSGDPRIEWLAGFVKKLKGAKALLICRTREKAEAVESALREKINVPLTVFHEGLTLLQRDRNAAYFADEDGAQILISSEIGSEGRNFQFAHHLVLFDLPEDPELLEQRIGRLDRIGQTTDIKVHVPYITGGPYAVLARWFHEGLNAFEESLHGAFELYERFREPVRALALNEAKPAPAPAKGRKKAAAPAPAPSEAELETLIAETVLVHQKVQKQLAEGQDRLLELSSRRVGGAAAMEKAIAAADCDTSLDEFMLEAFDVFGLQVEEIAPRTWIVTPSPGAEAFPGIPEGGITLTADRNRALSREDVAFLTWDHPAVTGAMETLLGSIRGNAAIGLTEIHGPDGVFVETVHVIEVVAPEHLHVERFLPPTPVRILLDTHFSEWTTSLGPLVNGPASKVLGKADLCFKLLPKMIEHAGHLAESRAYPLIADSIVEAQVTLGAEAERLRDLKAVNPNVRQSEIEAAQKLVFDMRDHLADARLRLDSVRMIFRASR